jgi:hypothetical protein
MKETYKFLSPRSFPRARYGGTSRWHENSSISQRAFNLAGFEVKYRARQQIVSGGRF